MSNNLVTSEWLNEHLSNPNLIILDASEESNVAGKKVEFEGVQIKGARYFDLENTFSDVNSTLPHTFPTLEHFQKESQNLGINKNSLIVVYDNLGIYTSPRVWWMYKIMGHGNVSVLDGGLSDWVKKGFETENKVIRSYEKGDFQARLIDGNIDSLDDMLINLETKKKLVIDARSKARFDGSAPEPRVGVKSGHIPASINLPFGEVLNEGKFKSKNELSTIFSSLKLDDQDLSIVCGSGLTSCILVMAIELVQNNKVSIYDGSWTEWGSKDNLPIDLSFDS